MALMVCPAPNSLDAYMPTLHAYPADPDDLPDCGPQVLLREPKMRQPDPEDKSCPSKTSSGASKPTQAPEEKANTLAPSVTSPKAVIRAEQVHTRPPAPEPSTHYLVNTTIGEEYAPCLRCPKTECRPKKIYKFGATVTIQCYTGYVSNKRAPPLSLIRGSFHPPPRPIYGGSVSPIVG